jgi:hypothetical protein
VQNNRGGEIGTDQGFKNNLAPIGKKVLGNN